MTIFIDNKYTRWYHAIVAARLASPLAKGSYSESHHIMPRSLGGSDDPGNLVPLTAREHFICHWLLTKMTAGDSRVKMLRAFWGMRANKSGKRYTNARAYDALKTEYAKMMSEMMMGENNPNWGNTWTDEQKQAQADKVRGDKNGAKQPGVGAKIAATKNGVKRESFSQEWIDAMSDAKMGEKNNMFGKKHREDSKALQSEKASLMMWVNDGTTSKRIYKTDSQPYLDSGWLQGRHYVQRGPRGPYKKKVKA
jgi:hypothetical protein